MNHVVPETTSARWLLVAALASSSACLVAVPAVCIALAPPSALECRLGGADVGLTVLALVLVAAGLCPIP